jgi:hypothetical protein
VPTRRAGGIFEPEDIEAMSLAFEEVCRALEIQFAAQGRAAFVPECRPRHNPSSHGAE